MMFTRGHSAEARPRPRTKLGDPDQEFCPMRSFPTFPAGALLLGAALLLGSHPLAAQEPAEGDTRPGIAVFPFENGGSYGPDSEDLAALTVGMQQMLLSELRQNSALRAIERGQLRALLEEQDLGASGRVEPGTAAELGRLVGARYMILGVFVDLFGDFRMDTRIVDVETGEILNAQTVRSNRSNLYDLVLELAGKITADADLPPLAREIREARAEREIPAETMQLYSRALQSEDIGDTERAAELYRRIVQEFPQFTEAQEALRQLEG
jgi:TolB-like protein